MTNAAPLAEEVSPADFVLAVDFGGTKVAVAAVDQAGHKIAATTLPVLADRGAEQVVERTLAAAAGLTTRVASTSGGTLRAVGVASPGVVLPDQVLLAPNVPGWSGLRLADAFEHHLGTPVVCANDVKAATHAEAWWGNLRRADPAIHLNLGTGIGVGVLIAGKVLSGAHGAAGEIGYNLRSAVPPETHDQDGRTGPHDGRAPLEELVGGGAIGERGRRFGGTGDAQSVFALAATDPAVRAFLDETLAELALHVTNMSILVDPERITVGGGLVNASDLVLPVLRSYLRSAVPFPPELVLARFTQDGALVGAATMAWESIGH